MPEISVIVPVWNGAAHLAESLASIPSGLDLEVIVSDDGSTDDSVAIARRAGARVVSGGEPQSGPGPTRNRGLAASDSPIVALLDADDWWPTGSLELRLQLLRQRPEIQIAHGMVETFLEGAVHERMRTRGRPLPHYGVHVGASLFRREALTAVGGFDEGLRFNDDADFFMKLWDHNIPKEFLETTCLYYRLHETNLCADAPSEERLNLYLLKRHKDRRKQGVTPALPLAEYMGWDQARGWSR